MDELKWQNFFLNCCLAVVVCNIVRFDAGLVTSFEHMVDWWCFGLVGNVFDCINEVNQPSPVST